MVTLNLTSWVFDSTFWTGFLYGSVLVCVPLFLLLYLVSQVKVFPG